MCDANGEKSEKFVSFVWHNFYTKCKSTLDGCV